MIKLANKARVKILMVTLPLSLIGVIHYCYTQVRNKEQRDKLIKLSSNLDYLIYNLTTTKKNKHNNY